MPYDNWTKRCDVYEKYTTVAERRKAIAALRINHTQPQPDDEGYYRRPTGYKGDNGIFVVTGWTPVSYCLSEKLPDAPSHNGLSGIMNGQYLSALELADEGLWSWVVSNPVRWEVYDAVVHHGKPWPTNGLPTIELPIDDPFFVPPLDPLERIIGRDHNAPPELLPEVEHSAAIDTAINASDGLIVTSDAEAAIANGAMNRIAELRLKAEKAGKALYGPPFREYKRLFALWTPMLARASDAEAVLKRKVLVHEDEERRRIASANALAEEARREQEEANARAADRAIAASEPEQAPVVEEAPLQVREPIRPTYGKRAIKTPESWHFDVVEDFDAVYQFFKAAPELQATLITMARAAIKAGREVPGVKRHWGIV